MTIAASSREVDPSETGKSPGRLPPLRVILAAPRGFCAGVERAIAAVEEALERFGPPVYVRRPIVHNLSVVRALEAKGAIFVEEIDAVPDGAVIIFSAHGVAKTVVRHAASRPLRAFDAVCPLVLKVHREVVRHHRDGRHVILVGHRGHPEVEGTLGQLGDEAASLVTTPDEVRALGLQRSTPVAYAIQTTFSVDEAAGIVDAISSRFEDVAGPSGSDICYATTNRQAALKAIAGEADSVIVAGASFSSNANRLADLAREAGCRSVQLVAEASEIDWSLLEDSKTLGVTAAASTPEIIVDDILAALRRRFALHMEERGRTSESAVFRSLRFA